ncbi:hypothetical protein TOK_0972 [Pseudonocardia sp. N23]|nr:hypothetical protein TOK_0972 [Pseudonocardia sp. N23]
MLRAMLWWPPVAFVIAIAVPGAGLLPIAVAGLALALIGIATAAVSRRRRPAEDVTPATGTTAAVETSDALAGTLQVPQQRAA